MVRRGASLLLLAALAAGLPAAPALAGAWTLPQGKGQVIVSGLYSEAMEAFDAGGRAGAIPVFRKAEVDLYAEYGVTDRWTAVLRSEVKTYASGEALSPDAARFGLSGGGARLRLWQEDGAVLSGEVVARVATPFDRRARSDEGGGEVDLRLMAGKGFERGSWSGFAEVQGAYRLGLGGRADAICADLTVGIRPWPQMLFLAQSFNTLPLGQPGSDLAESTEHKLQLSAVYDVNPRLSLQVGGLATVAGRDALKERAIVTAVWFRF